ncbi:MAG: alanine racemase [Alphaproteobacteria bacterium]
MRGELTINLQSLRKNYRALNALSSENCKTAAVVKANAYGIGVEYVAPALYTEGARKFFVATLDEGVQLRGILSDDVTIFILNGFWAAERETYHEHNLIPVLNSYNEIDAYLEFAIETSAKLPANIHFDIGMNRLGVPSEEYEAVYTMDLSGLDILYVMGHLSSSEELDNPHNEIQRKRFEEIAAHFPYAKKCLSNSGGVFLGDDYHHDLTRPGICLYGGCASKKMVELISPVVSLHAPILQIHDGEEGEFTGYNETYRISKKTKLGIIPIGYADGIFRSLGNAGSLYCSGHELPICGRVSMDLVICDLKAIPEDEFPKVGDMIEVIGDHQTLDKLATDAGTISYEILTNLGRRYTRSVIK